MVHIFLFSLITSMIHAKPNVFLLYRSYFATKKIIWMDLTDINTTGEISGKKNVISPKKFFVVGVLLYGVRSVAKDVFHFLSLH